MFKLKHFEPGRLKRPYSVSRLFWEALVYLRQAPSATKWLFLQIFNLFRDEYRHCSCIKYTVSGKNSKTKTKTISKQACKHQRWMAARACLIHIPPLSLTTFVLYTNLSEKYWENVGASKQNVRLNALQFAAKIFEMLIAASLSLIAANYIQYELLLGKGLPLGSVLAGFQVTVPSSVLSLSFWRKLFVKGLRTRRFLFVLLLMMLVVLCAIVGPSSAILLLPSIDWWPFEWKDLERTSFLNIVRPRYFIEVAESVLWPTHITVANSFSSDCKFTNSSLPDHCPSSGLSSIRDAFTFGANGGQDTFNITLRMTSPLSRDPNAYIRNIEGAYRLDTGYRHDEGNEVRDRGIFKGSSTSVAVDYSLAKVTGLESPEAKYQFGVFLRGGKRTFVPVVSTICTKYTIPILQSSREDQYYKNPDSIFDSSLDLPGGPKVKASAYKNLLKTSQNASIWISPHALGNFTTIPSITAAYFTKNYSSDTNGVRNWWAASIACSMYASWEPVAIYLDQATRTFHSPYIQEQISQRYADEETMLEETFEPRPTRSFQGRPIQIDADWANLALPHKEIMDVLGRKLEEDQNRARGSDRHSLLYTYAPAISLLTTDALARIGMYTNMTLGSDYPIYEEGDHYDWGMMSIKDVAGIDHKTTTEIIVYSSRFGYSFSVRGTTRRLAIGVLLTYVAITLIHIVVVLWYSWSCTDLGSIYDLVNLSVSSSKDLPEEIVSFGLAELKK